MKKPLKVYAAGCMAHMTVWEQSRYIVYGVKVKRMKAVQLLVGIVGDDVITVSEGSVKEVKQAIAEERELTDGRWGMDLLKNGIFLDDGDEVVEDSDNSGIQYSVLMYNLDDHCLQRSS